MNYIFQNIVRTGGGGLTKALQASFVHQTYESSATAAVEMTARRGVNYDDALKLLPVDQGKEIYIGSFYYGFHALLQGKSKYIAVFRNPLDRAISYVNALFRGRFVSSFASWLQSGAPHEVDNYLTRACVQDGIHRPCNEALLKEAKNNLMQDYIVGLGNALPDMVARINQATGKQLTVQDEAGFGAEDIIVPLTEADKRLFKQKNAFDYRLFDFVKGLSVLQSGGGLDAEVVDGKEKEK